MILVTGATGELGKATINHLVKLVPASNIIGLARDERKASFLSNLGVGIRYGDYTDKSSLIDAFQGSDKLLLISSNSKSPLEEHKQAIDAAKGVGVRHILYTSAAVRDYNNSPLKPLAESHIETEKYLKESGLDYTIFQNTLYADAIPIFVGEKVLQTGIYFPAGDGRVAFAIRKEIGEAIANALASSGHENVTYLITGSEAHSFSDIAMYLSKIAGKPVPYVSPEPEDFAGQLRHYGISEGGIRTSNIFGATIKHGDMDQIDPALETLLGRKPGTLESYLKETYT